MASSFVRHSIWFVGSVFAGVLLVHCSAMESADGSEDTGYGTGASPDRDKTSLDVGNEGGASGTVGTGLNPLCGAGDCIPDDAKSCTLGPSMGGAGGEGPVEGELGGYIGFPENPGDLGPQGASCHVVFSPECEGDDCDPARSCGEVGAGAKGEPCFASTDCGAGLACVGDAEAGSCQPYCCRGTVDSCGENEFCEARVLAGPTARQVPVCVPVDNCSLTDPFPCPEGRSCTCDGESACVVVRADGQTACARPGTGREGDACTGDEPGECAHGYVCSKAAGCLKLCSTVAMESGCDAGATCQTPSDFPLDLGVCIAPLGGPSVAE